MALETKVSITSKTKELVTGMSPWFERYRSGVPVRDRSKYEEGVDSGILAASELIRRLTKDEQLAYQIHALVSGGVNHMTTTTAD